MRTPTVPQRCVAVTGVCLGAAMFGPGCFYVGGGARTTFDTKTWKPTYSAHGYLGAFAMQEQDEPTLGSVDRRHGFWFALAMGAGHNQRLDRWEAIVGPRVGWLFPHGMAELGFETRFGAQDPQLFALMLRVGPRVEVSHTYGRDARAGRRAHTVDLPLNVGFSVGDGFRPEVGAGLDYHLMAWRPGARFD